MQAYSGTQGQPRGRTPWTLRRRHKVTEVRTTTEDYETLTLPVHEVLEVLPNVTTPPRPNVTIPPKKRRQGQLADFFEPPANYVRPKILKKLKKSPIPKYALWPRGIDLNAEPPDEWPVVDPSQPDRWEPFATLAPIVDLWSSGGDEDLEMVPPTPPRDLNVSDHRVIRAKALITQSKGLIDSFNLPAEWYEESPTLIERMSTL